MTIENTLKSRQLGSTGLAVFSLTLGCMGMSAIYGSADDDESIATIHAAIDQGINLLDTGNFYGCGHNEMLIARALNQVTKKDVLGWFAESDGNTVLV
jgi:aryl-alcohol dehydrogenase-like predicted oxidoreductase